MVAPRQFKRQMNKRLRTAFFTFAIFLLALFQIKKIFSAVA
jgi:hypothetical protein